MRPLLLAAGLAVGLHGLLFSMEAEWAKKKAIHRLRPEPVTFILSYKKPKIQTLPPAKKPIESKKKSIQVKKKPQRKKARARPFEKVRITQKEREEASKPEETVQSKAPRMIPSHVEPAPVNEREAPDTPSPLHIGEKPDMPSLLPIREAIPVYRKNPSPKYPGVARRRGYQGTVIMEVLVNREGRVEDLRLFQSSGYTVLDRAATDSVKNWLFEPGMRGDEKVEMWVKVPVRFRLR